MSPIPLSQNTLLEPATPEPELARTPIVNRGKTSYSIKASSNPHFLSENKSIDASNLKSSNLADPVFVSTAAAHVGLTTSEGTADGYAPGRTASLLNQEAAQEPDEPRLNPTGTPRIILSTERRKARTIQNLPEALRRQVAATPEDFHNMILQA